MTTHNDESLKPCPYCGKQPAYFAHKLYCQTKGCAAGEHVVSVEAWSRRAQPDAAAIRNAALEDAAKEFDRRDDGSGGFYDPAEPAEIIRALQSTTPAEPDYKALYQTLIDDALAKVSELGTVGVMKWLAVEIQLRSAASPTQSMKDE